MQTRFIRQAAVLFVPFWLLASGFTPAWAKGPYATALVLSPDGTRLYLASVVPQGRTSLVPALWTIDTATLQVLPVTPPKPMPGLSSLAVSADGSRLYLGRNDGVDVIDALSYQRLAPIPAGPDPLSLAVSADGHLLYAAVTDWSTSHYPRGQLAVIDAALNQVITTLDVGRVSVFAAVSPDNRRVYIITYPDYYLMGLVVNAGDTLRVIDAASLQVVASVRFGGMVHAAAISPDGKRLYLMIYSSFSTRVAAMDASTGQMIGAVTLPDRQYIYAAPPVISPDGKRLYLPLGRGPASIRILDTDTLTFTGALTLPAGAAYLAISPDGKRLYAADPPGDAITVIDTDTLRPETTIRPQS